MWVDNVGTINSFIYCSGAPYQQARWRSYNFHKGPAKHTQHFNATSYNIAISRCGMLWRSWPNAWNIMQNPNMLPHCKSLIQHLAHFQQGGQTCATRCTQQCCKMLRLNVVLVWPDLNNMVTYKTEKNWEAPPFIRGFIDWLGDIARPRAYHCKVSIWLNHGPTEYFMFYSNRLLNFK